MASAVARTPDIYAYSVQFLLGHMFEKTAFRVDIEYDVHRSKYLLRIAVPYTHGVMYVTQWINAEDLTAAKAPRLSDETIATITLLVG